MKKTYIAWVRKQPCAECRRGPPVDAHHIRGVGVPRIDDRAVPLCHECHMDLHDLSGNGRFAGVEKAKRKAIQDAWLAKYRMLFAAEDCF